MPSIDLAAIVERARANAAEPTASALPEAWEIGLQAVDEGAFGAALERAVSLRPQGIAVTARQLRHLAEMVDPESVAPVVGLNLMDGSDDLASVAGLAEVAVAEGARALELLAPASAIEDGDIGLVGDLIESCRTLAGPICPIRLFLPGGLGATGSIMTGIARTAVMAGADYLGLLPEPATGRLVPEEAAVLLSVIGEADGRVGFKAAGVEDRGQALMLWLLAQELVQPAAGSALRIRFEWPAERLADGLPG